ncbi:MAG: hypothetical protein QMC77_04690 [Methanocellales archaeon]|nr:hypothetical protein [Methanocellales archaeon]
MTLSVSDLEARLVKVDEELHSILNSIRKGKERYDVKKEVEELKSLIDRIGKNRLNTTDTTKIIREMREKSYDL